MSVLDQGTGANLSLITCTPVGTSKYRLVVHATQISPKISTDSAPVQNAQQKNQPLELPGSAKASFWQVLQSWL